MKIKNKLEWDRKEFKDMHEMIKDKNHLSHYEFFRIRNFKLQNPSHENEKSIKEATQKAFELAKNGNIKGAVETIDSLDGVGIPIASAILAMRFPKDFCIIDWRVIEELNKTTEFKGYLNSSEIYEKYLILMRKEAKKQKKNLRDYERELFEKSFSR